MQTLLFDLRPASLRTTFRQLARAPGYTLTVILMLALGIGATTAIFSLVEGILLRPLPFRDPGRLVKLGDHLGHMTTVAVTAREIATYSSASSAFQSIGGYAPAGFEISGGETPEAVNAERLNAQVFPTLGVQPLLGRVFTPQEEQARQPVAVISYSLWLTRFHSDPAIVGRALNLDRTVYTIIGVMPRSFEFPLQPGRLDQPMLWVPLSLTAQELSDENTGAWRYQLVGRLKDGVSLPNAAQDAARVAQQVMRDFPSNMTSLRIQGDAILLRDAAVGDAAPLLRTLLCAVAIVLLIACVNVAGLMLVRAIRGRREYALRLALGARAGALLRASATEGLMLSLTGGILGLLLAALAVRIALPLLPESLPRLSSVAIDPVVIAFALVLSAITGLVCGLVPALTALRLNLTETIREGSQSAGSSASHAWLRSSLVVAEIAIALVLVNVAGGFLRSFEKMRSVDIGFQPDHVLVAGYQLPLNHYATQAAEDAFNAAVVGKLSALPGVTAAGITNSLPGSSGAAGTAYTLEGIPASAWHLQFASFQVVYGDYFHALGIHLIQGRLLNQDDRADTTPVIVVNKTMANHLWPGQNPLGKRFHLGNPHRPYPWVTVVGVVDETKLGVRDAPAVDQFYISALQPAIPNSNPGQLVDPASGYLALRSTMPPEQMIQSLRAAVASVDPQLALEDIQPMNSVIADSEAPRRFDTGLISAFAATALLLALIGMYAVVAFSVSMRTQEIAVRMALGAQRSQIARLIVGSGARLALLGCAIGIGTSLAVSHLVSAFLFGVTATDPATYAAGAVLMMAMALLACALPARRAASADPVKALRSV